MLLFAGLAVAAPVPAQERAYTLGAPQLTVAEPFSAVAGLVELSDARLVVVDSREQLVKAVDRAGTSVTTIGTQGDGPLEYRRPFSVKRLPGDSLLVYDVARGGRFLVLSPSGGLVREFAVPRTLLQGGLTPPRGIDAKGRIYWAGDVITMNPQGVKRNLTQNVRRWTPPAERFDTVAAVADHAPEMHEHKFFPYAERDDFVVAADGRIGVLSAREYRLRWYQEGKLVREGPALSHDQLPVTAEARTEFRLARAPRAGGGGNQVQMTGPAGEPVAPSPAARRSMEEIYPDIMFPRIRPPFVENGAQITPGEDVWVTRSSAKGSDPVRIDVLAADGTRRGHVVLPLGRRVVALEKSAVYLARTDEDGLEWIERYAWPAGLR